MSVIRRRQSFTTQTVNDGNVSLTFVRNVASDIVPEVETAAENAHFFDALFHITQNTRLRKADARNHLRSMHFTAAHKTSSSSSKTFSYASAYEISWQSGVGSVQRYRNVLLLTTRKYLFNLFESIEAQQKKSIQSERCATGLAEFLIKFFTQITQFTPFDGMMDRKITHPFVIYRWECSFIDCFPSTRH